MESNLKSMIKHLFTISIGTVINMMVGFFSVPVITRLVNPDAYGLHSMFTLYADIAVMVLCLGLDQAYVRFYYNNDTFRYKKSLLRFCCNIPIITCICISVIAFIVRNMSRIDIRFSNTIILLLAVYIMIELVSRFSFLTLRLEYDTKSYTIMNVIHKTIYAVLAVLMLKSIDGFDFELLVFSTVLSLLIPTIISIIIKKNIWFSNSPSCVIDKREILKYGLPFILSMGIVTLFNGIDRMSLNYYCGSTEVGVYAGAQSILKVFTIIQTSFNAIWKPYAIEGYESKSMNREIYSKIFNFACLIMFSFGLTLICVKDIFALILGSEYRDAAYVIPCLCFYPIMYTISEVSSVGIDLAKKSTKHIIVAIISCVMNFLGNSIFVPVLGGKGAAISTGISYIVFFIVRTFYSTRDGNLKFDIRKVSTAILLSFAYAIYATFFECNYMSIIIYIVIIFIILFLYKKEFQELSTRVKNLIGSKKL